MLRQEMTPAERKLWLHLRELRAQGIHFRRQHAVGRYVCDFCAPKQKLIIELDGEPHRAQQEADVERTHQLEALGYRVLRFWNSQVIDDLDGVVQKIRSELK